MKNKDLNKEEHILQEKLNNLNFGFKESNWQEFETKLNASTQTTSTTKWLKVASVMLVLTASVYFILLDYSSNKKDNDIPTKLIIEKNNKQDNFQPNEENTESFPLSEDEEQNIMEEEYEIEDFEDEIFYSSEDSVFNENTEEDLNEIASEPNGIETQNENESFDIDAIDRIEINTPREVCLYSTINFTLKNNSAFKEVHWKIDGDRFSGEYKFFEAGEYTITASVKKGKVELKDTLTLNLEEPLEWDFTYEQKENLFNDFIVQFKTDASVPLTWHIKEEEFEAQQPLFDFQEEGLYDVTAISKDEKGCVTEVYKPVAVVKDFELYAADAFTPNADGLNDEFLPTALETIEYHYTFTVYNIKGKEIFTTSEKGVGWNGNLHNTGTALPKGNYLWKVIVRNEEGRERMFSGTVKIVDFDN